MGHDDNGYFSFGPEYRERSALAQTDRPVYLNKGYSASGTPNPGHFVVPTRDATGALTGESSVLRDPGCGVAVSPGGDGFENAGGIRNNISGTAVGSVCRFQFGESTSSSLKKSCQGTLISAINLAIS